MVSPMKYTETTFHQRLSNTDSLWFVIVCGTIIFLKAFSDSLDADEQRPKNLVLCR